MVSDEGQPTTRGEIARLDTEAGALAPDGQRQHILAGAADVFSRDGYEGASMSRIARCAGVSKGTLYNYFDSKAALFAAWVADECARRIAVVFDGSTLEAGPRDGLRGIGLRMLHMMMSTCGLTMYRVTISEANKFPELARIFFNTGPSRATAVMSDWLEEQVAAGHLAIDDPAFAADQFFALCQTRVGMMRRLGMLTELDDATAHRIVDSAVDMFLLTYGVTP